MFDYSLRNLEFWVRTLSYKKFLRKFGADRQNWAKNMATEIQGILLPRKVKAFGKIETVITNSLMLQNIAKQFPKNILRFHQLKDNLKFGFKRFSTLLRNIQISKNAKTLTTAYLKF